MPRPKKIKAEADDSDNIEEVEPVPKKKRTVKSKTSAKSKSKKSKKVVEPEQSDEVSELELEGESDNETQDSDEVVEGRPQRRSDFRLDPDVPIKLRETRPDMLLQYLIDLGKETLNPSLRFGCQGVLSDLRSGRRHNNFNRNARGGRGRGRGFAANTGRGGRTYTQNLPDDGGNFQRQNYGSQGNHHSGPVNQYPSSRRRVQNSGDDDLYS